MTNKEIETAVFAVLKKWKDERAWDKYTREGGPNDAIEVRGELMEIIQAVLASQAKPEQTEGWVSVEAACAAVEALKSSHIASVKGECEYANCDFVAAWDDAIAAIKAAPKAQP